MINILRSTKGWLLVRQEVITGKLDWSLWWFEWEWPSEAHMFESLFPSWCNYLEVWPCWREYVILGGLWGFKILEPFSVCFLCLQLMNQDVNPQLFLSLWLYSTTKDSIWNHKPQINVFWVTFVMVLYHSIRKVIKTFHVCQCAREIISQEGSF